jgi:Domain of unknown function (DUF4382)
MVGTRMSRLVVVGAVGLAAAACGGSLGAPRVATVAVRLAAVAPSPASAAATTFNLSGDGHHPGWFVTPNEVDSLVVTVTGVRVHAIVADSDSAEGIAWGDSATDADSAEWKGAMEGEGGRWGDGFHFGGWFGHDADSVAWYTLDLVGSGRLDLLHLPTDSANGLVLASGDVPPGDYRRVRLEISDATIWFDTTVTAWNGLTFKPDTGYSVLIPSAEQSGLKTDAGLTVPNGGGDVTLMFDTDATIRGALVTGSGKIIVIPVIRSWHWHWGGSH